MFQSFFSVSVKYWQNEVKHQICINQIKFSSGGSPENKYVFNKLPSPLSRQSHDIIFYVRIMPLSEVTIGALSNFLGS